MNNSSMLKVEGVLMSKPKRKDNATVEFLLLNGKNVSMNVYISTKNELAELCIKYLKKYSRVLISGKLCEDLHGTYIDCTKIVSLSPNISYILEYDWLYWGEPCVKSWILVDDNGVDSLTYPYGKRYSLKTKKACIKEITVWARKKVIEVREHLKKDKSYMEE